MSILLDYVNVTFEMKNNIPLIKLRIKEEKKLTHEPLFRESGQPVSGSELKYWINYLGKEIGTKVYNERRKLFSKNKLIYWYIKTFNPENKNDLYEYVNLINKKISKKLLEHYSSPEGKETKKKLKERNKKWAPIIGKMNSDRWKNDKTWAENYIKKNKENGVYEKLSKIAIKRNKDPEFKKKFKIACNKPDRIKKISKSTKERWQYWLKNEPEMIKKIITSNKNRKYELNGQKMYSIEYKIGKLLSEMKINWEYEKLIDKYIPDFYLPDYDTIIECYGDYYHANPKFKKSGEFTHKTRSVDDIWLHDKLKKEKLLSIVSNFIVLWEFDINNNITECKNKIKKIL